MDGYASAGSVLSDQGFKITHNCAPPKLILIDLDILGTAPSEMNGWGYGDLAGKVPAGGDWIVADSLGLEIIDPIAWPLVQGNLRLCLENPEGIRKGEPEALQSLIIGLLLTGLAMEFFGRFLSAEDSMKTSRIVCDFGTNSAKSCARISFDDLCVF